MQTAGGERLRYEIRFPGLPLAVYREITAHLRQVGGVDTGLVPQPSGQSFDYYQSQVGGLWIQYAADADSLSRQWVTQILDYYSQRYCPWEENQ
ncbi:hypothetical protein [Coleofasciculus sp. FACHB-SPT9]|uniref:hypothetical protein n=1 Tax=Cyanophyceae TaxID=3028117 RepID=UPI001683C699|nr:hypothetical protein [Coleofasciculus sp. FACHB-SPT9]